MASDLPTHDQDQLVVCPRCSYYVDARACGLCHGATQIPELLAVEYALFCQPGTMLLAQPVSLAELRAAHGLPPRNPQRQP